MPRSKFLYSGLTILILLVSLTACANSATPTPSATPIPDTETPVPATETQVPTETPIPSTEIPSQLIPTQDTTIPQATVQATSDIAVATSLTPVVNSALPASSGAADKYQYIGQNIADKSQVKPGATITIQWSVKNTGTTAWTTDYSLRYFSGVKAEETIYNLQKAVPAGQTTTLTVTLIAPSTLGDYNTWYKLTNKEGQNFGDVDFTFTVSNTPQKVVSTPTP
jgi:hypothetical protein